MTGVLERVRELAPTLRERSLEIEKNRSLPPDLVATLRESGLFRMARPIRLGGTDLPPGTIVDVVAELSYADPATGWCVLIANIGDAFLGWLEPSGARQIVASGPDPIIAGGLAPLGEGVGDGAVYRVTGRWPYASGCTHADWLTGGFRVMRDGRPVLDQRGVPQMRLAYFPAGQARVDDTWHVAGLAGTGSHDVVVDDLAVPAELTSVPFVGRAADHPEPLYRLTAFTLLLVLMSGFPLGVARRALDEARQQLAAGDRLAASGRSADPSPVVTLANHESAVRAARHHLFATLEQVLASAPPGQEVEYWRRAELAAAAVHAFDTGRAAALDCYRLGGARALFEDNPLQRCMRDLVAGCQHVAFSADSRARIARAMLAGQPGPQFFGV